MRVRATATLFSLLTTLPYTAGAAAEWQDLFESGTQALDQADYKAAETELAEACRLASGWDDASAQRDVCLRLAQVQAEQANLRDATKTLTDLVEALLENGSNDDLVIALLELADVTSARALLVSTLEHLRASLALVPSLEATGQIATLTRIAQHYLVTQSKDTGFALLEDALVKALAAPPSADTSSIRSRMQLAHTLKRHERAQDARDVLTPVVLLAKRSLDSSTETPNDLWESFFDAVGLQLDILGALERTDEKEILSAVLDEIRGASGLPARVGHEGIESPRLRRHKAPSYTEGARHAKVEGTVNLAMEVWPDGRAHNVRVIGRLPYGLTWQSIRTIRTWRFKPADKEGEPIQVNATVDMNFRLR